jgi:hypothetical protein
MTNLPTRWTMRLIKGVPDPGRSLAGHVRVKVARQIAPLAVPQRAGMTTDLTRMTT